jgi:hypothetical protein
MKLKTGFLTLVLAANLTHGADVPPPDKLLASDTLGVLTIPEYSKSKARFSQQPLGRLWDDPSMKAFREKFVGKLKSEVIAPLEKEFGLKYADYSGLAQGQVTLALSANGPKDADGDAGLGFVFLVDCRDKSAQLQTNLLALRTKWVDSGKKSRTDKIRDVEFTTFIFDSDELGKVMDKVFPGPEKPKEDDNDGKGSKKLEWMVGQSGSLFILGNSTRDIEKVLVNQSGGGASRLAENSSFASSYSALLRDTGGYAWVDLKTILGNLAKAAGHQGGAGGQPFGMQADKLMSVLGLTGLQSLALSMKDTPDGSLVNINVSVPESGRRGLFKLLSFSAKDASPPAFVPADAVKFSRWRLDLPKAWETLENTLVEAVPQIAGVIKMVLDNAGKDQDPNFDLRKSLIQNLGDDIINFEKVPRASTLDSMGSPPSLTLLSSSRPEQLASSIRALTALMPAQASKYKEREFLGRKVYALSLPTSMSAGGKAVEKTLHYAASGGYVALTTDIALLEEYLRSNDGSGKSLRDAPGLAENAQKVGGMGTGFFTFENQRETTRAELEILKKESGTLANLFSASPIAGRIGMADNASKFKEWVDFSLLPPFEQISKYFYQTLAGGAVTSDGFNFKIFNATSPELKK